MMTYKELLEALKEAIQSAKENYCVNQFEYERALILIKAIFEKLEPIKF